MSNSLQGKKILLIGGTGSLGKALIRRLMARNEIFVFSRDEAKHWTIKNELGQLSNVHYLVGDVRDQSRVMSALRFCQPNVIILAAALKQVDTCEVTPTESIKTNIIGTQNLIDCSLNYSDTNTSLECVLFVSTDKACAPTNVYGMCKAISERLITSVGVHTLQTKYVAVRYGNVLESRGSIIPLFKHQVEHKGFVTVTSGDMTRFIMTLSQSIDLIQRTILGASSGEVWIPKLTSMKIMDLAEIFSKRYGCKIKIIGVRPGEKLHEELISISESSRVTREGYDMVMSPSTKLNQQSSDYFNYSSEDYLLTQSKLDSMLADLGLFSRDLSFFDGKYIEDIRTD